MAALSKFDICQMEEGSHPLFLFFKVSCPLIFSFRPGVSFCMFFCIILFMEERIRDLGLGEEGLYRIRDGESFFTKRNA